MRPATARRRLAARRWSWPRILAGSGRTSGTRTWSTPQRNEVHRLGRSGTGACHCPTSNMRLASGVMPLRQLQAAGARVGLGVDGSASNDGSHLLAEARQALLLHRLADALDDGHVADLAVSPAPRPMLTARDVLRLATRGGAAVLGRDDIGQLAPGKAADLVAFRTDTLGMAGGAVHDPLAALVFCPAAGRGFQRDQRCGAGLAGSDRWPGRGGAGGAAQPDRAGHGQG